MREKSNCHEFPNRISFGSFILCVWNLKSKGPSNIFKEWTFMEGLMLGMYQENCMFDFVADADLGSKFACQQWCLEICVCTSAG